MSTATAVSRRQPHTYFPTLRMSRCLEVPELVSLVRLHDRRSEHDRFVCDSGAWNVLLDVAVSFGWKQRGTTYLPSGFSTASMSAVSRMTRHDYRPGDARDPKCVDNIDAIAWAAALSTGSLSSHLPGMLTATHRVDAGSAPEPRIAGTAFAIVMKDFTQYAFGGAFAFSRAEQR